MLNYLKYDEKIDIWALGVIMYMCVSGKHPFITRFTNTNNNIKNQAISFEEEAFENYSQYGKQFI